MADLISKIKDAGNTAHAIRAGAIPKVTVDSTSTSTAFTVTDAPGIIDLVDGVCIYITNNKVASATNCTLNVNGLGAKPIYMSNSASGRVTTQFALNTTCLFVYNSSRVSGGCWDLVVGYNSNTTYSAGTGLSLSSTTFNHSNSVTAQTTQAIYPITIDAQGHIASYGTAVTPITSHQTIKQDGITGATVNRFGTCSTAAATAAKTVSITTGTFSLEAGARVSVKFSNANTANSPTLNVASKGAKNIFHKGAQITTGDNKALLAGTVDFIYDGTQWHLVGNYIDAKVTQTLTSEDADYPLLGAPTGQTATTTTTACFSTGLTFNPTNRSLSCGWDHTTTSYTGVGLSGNRGALTLKTYIEQSGGTTLTYQRSVVRTYPGKISSDAGLLLSIDSGGLTIIGSGESATSLANLISDDQSASGATQLTLGGTLTGSYTGDSEQMIVSSDNNIFFITNCNTIADRKAVVLSNQLSFYPDTTETGSIGTSSYYWNTAYIKTITGNLVGNVTGNADTATSATSATNATNAYHTKQNPTSSTTYGISFHASANSAGNKGLLTNDGVRYMTLEGTASALGYGYLLLGNATASGTAGNKYGAMRFYTTGTTYTQLASSSDTTSLLFSQSGGTTGSNVSPATTAKYDLGTSSLKWRNVHTKTVNRIALKGVLTGTGTDASDKGSGVSPRYFPAKWTFNTGLTAADGDVFIIKLPTAGHSYGVFLSVDNGTNYYPISTNGTSRLTTHFGNGYFIAVMFKSDGSTASIYPLNGGDATTTVSGGCWQVLNYYDANTTYTPQSLGFGYGTCATAAATAAKAVTLSGYTLVTNGFVSVKFTYDVPANATMNINSKGAKNIYFRGAKITAGVIKAGDVATFVYSSYYHLISIDRWGVDIGDINTVLEAVL